MLPKQYPTATIWCLYLALNEDSNSSSATKDLVATKRTREVRDTVQAQLNERPSTVLIIEVRCWLLSAQGAV